MKRIVFSVIIVILSAIFFCVYSIPTIRETIINLDAVTIAPIYDNVDNFFSTVWNSFFASWISIDTSNPSLAGTTIVGIFVALILLIVLLTSTLITNSVKKRKDYNAVCIAKEIELLSKENDAPSSFTHYDANNVVFVNESTPLISLENKMIESSSRDGVVNLNDKKTRPTIRIILSIIYSLFVLLYIFIRVLWSYHYDSIYQVFESFLTNEFVVLTFTEFDKFFSALSGSITDVPAVHISQFVWTWGMIIEILFTLLMASLILVLVLWLCHVIVKSIRKKDNTKSNFTPVESSEVATISKKNLSFFGYVDNSEITGDINSIATLSMSDDKKIRTDMMYKKASYIDDISDGVVSKGKISNSDFLVEPSEVRKELIKENIEEDLSANQGVTINDILSIEDKSKTSENDVNIETFIVPDEGVQEVDINSIDINILVTKDDQIVDPMLKQNLEDNISFDEDGYAYLVKEGKSFVDEEEDISDVIESEEMDESAIKNRFGDNYYSLLNELEPFKLKHLSYDDETKNKAIREYNNDIISKSKIITNELTAKAFVEKKIDESDSVSEAITPLVAASEQEKVAPNKPIVKPVKIIKPLKQEKKVIKPLVATENRLSNLNNIDKSQVKLSPLDAFHQGITLVVPTVKPITIKPIKKEVNKNPELITADKIKSIDEVPSFDAHKPIGPIEVKNVNSALFVKNKK